MLTNLLRACSLGLGVLVLCECTPPSASPGNQNGNTGSTFPHSATVNLGANSEFDITAEKTVGRVIPVTLADELGVNEVSELGFALDAADVAVQPTQSATGGSEQTTSIDVLVAAHDAADACSSGIEVGTFGVTFDGGEVKSVSPTQLTAGAAAVSAARTGVFDVCLRANSSVDQTLIVNRLEVLFDKTTPALTCAQVWALDEVQSAIAALNDAEIAFALQDGDTPRNIEDTYSVRETITFDPDGTDSGSTPARQDTFSNQSEGRITRTSGEAVLDQSISGDQDGINLCVLARSYGATCDQTIARLESYAVSNNGRTLEGEFLTVVVERHTAGPSTCGEKNDFVYGTIDLTAESTTFEVTRLAKIDLPEDFTPDLLILPDDESQGTVTDNNSDAALRFPTNGGTVTSPLSIPGQLDAAGYNGIGLSQDNEVVGLVSDNPDEFLVFNNTTGALELEAVPRNTKLGGDVFDFSPDSTLAYVVGPDADDADSVSIFRTQITVADPIAAQHGTPDAETPELSRLNPKGTQLAVLLNGKAGAGESSLLTFLDVEKGGYSPTLDLLALTDGFVSDRFLVYAYDGSAVFMAGAHGVVVAETSEPFATKLVDVSGDRRDAAIAIDLSNDGEVLVVAIDQINGDANFAIVDVTSLGVIHRTKLERISERGAIDVAHFDTGRACLVINERLRVIPVQTVSPFAVGEELIAADNDFAPLLGRVAAGGNVIAVANTSETALYLYQLAP